VGRSDRTGPFQPRPIGFASHYSEPYSTNFGIDLRKYDETNRDKEGGIVPKVLVVLLEEIERRMKDVKDEDGTQLFRFSIVIKKSKLMWEEICSCRATQMLPL